MPFVGIAFAFEIALAAGVGLSVGASLDGTTAFAAGITDDAELHLPLKLWQQRSLAGKQCGA